MTLLVYLPLLLYFVGLFLVIQIISKPGPTTSSTIKADKATAIAATDKTSAPATTVKTRDIALFMVGLFFALILIAFVTDHQQHTTSGVSRKG